MTPSNSPAKQQNILCCSNARKHIDAIQRDSASLVSLVDSASFLSTSTGRTSKLSMLFDFDDELFISKPYENFIRKTVKFSIRSQKRPRSPANGVSETASVSLPSELLPEEDHKGIVLLGK